jgi:acyl-CoA hydrolase
MKLADEAAALAAIKHSRQRVVTVGMDRMDFLVPIYVGELVTFRATVNAAWRTSMEVGVRVEAELRRANRLAEREEIIARRAQEARRTARDDEP